MKVGTRFEAFGMKFYVHKQTYTINDKKCFIAQGQGVREVYHQLIVQENGFIYGTNIKVKSAEIQAT